MTKTSLDTLREWLKEAKEEGATHMVVFSDDFSHEYYPVNCDSKRHAESVVREKDGKNMQRMVEVYNLRKGLEKQLRASRSVNY